MKVWWRRKELDEAKRAKEESLKEGREVEMMARELNSDRYRNHFTERMARAIRGDI